MAQLSPSLFQLFCIDCVNFICQSWAFPFHKGGPYLGYDRKVLLETGTGYRTFSILIPYNITGNFRSLSGSGLFERLFGQKLCFHHNSLIFYTIMKIS